MRLQGKVAVITGGASGMGLATVMRFLDEGAQVVVADYNAVTGEAAVSQATEAGFGDAVSFVRTDVAQEDDIVGMLRHALDSFGRLDVLFNNAGVGGAIGPLTETTVEDWDYTFDVLAKGVFLGIKHAARILREQGGGGSIINTASIAGLSGDAGPLVYSAAKAAVINLSRSAAVELAADHIRVNAICPGFITTPWWQSLGAEAYEKLRTSQESSVPLRRVSSAEDIAETVVWLMQADAPITGETLLVDGGAHLGFAPLVAR